jgi:hypothetical protein
MAFLMDGHHFSDSSTGHLVGSEGGSVLHPFRSWGLSGNWLLRIEPVDTAEKKTLSPIPHCAVDLLGKSHLKWTVTRLGSKYAFLLE